MIARTRALGFALVVIVVSVVSCCLHSSLAAVGTKPNIVFILTDDQRLEDIEHMPTLQRLLVKQGLSFQNYFSNVSLCCPSRTSILRGQFAHNTGIFTNGGPNGGFDSANTLGLENSTIAVWLQDHGYETALIGKYLNHYPGDQGPTYVPPGWSYWASPAKGNAYGQYNYTLNENGKLVEYGHKPSDYGTDVYANKAINFVKECGVKKKPFFIYLAVYAPHSPATPADRHMHLFTNAKIPRTPAFNEASMSAKPQFMQKLLPLSPDEVSAADEYYGKRLRSLQAVDEAIGTIYDTLAKTHQLDNTYIVFAADNGFHLGEHRLRRGKQSAYETDIHLPLIVRGPGIAQGSKASELTGNIDLAPTFAELAGATIPTFVDGRSLVPLLKAQKPSNWREVFLVEHWLLEREGRGGRKRNRKVSQSEEGCQSSACAEHCAHMAQCYCDKCGEPTRSMISAIFDGSTHVGDTFRLAKYGDEEREELAEQSEQSSPLVEKAPAQGEESEDSLQMTDGKAATAPARSGKRHAARRAKRTGEYGTRIPQYRALRHADALYTEYVNGEKEYYKLVDDQSEVNNRAANLPEGVLQADAARALNLSKSASNTAREIESHFEQGSK